ncbi:DUF3810 domain-containing protein [Mucilaginibacter auburnensis]|uniref:Uncharacterized protein DUF3810 n=1 Tax=Mucilaginibacter auburnensis TaxID=1457233 RepID=A0A2H9VNP3_9SPHI|nr:DUF3810 domain-containing protein [Mucilaginibacter auburnensis]PJJ79936.1 uncharacterized protein DUF3810 [Mucilaginibacter auburnensis]
MPKPINPYLKQLITIAALAVAIWLLGVFTNYPQLVERYYSQAFYVGVCYVLHPLLNILPFSIGDVIYIAVIGYLLYLLGRCIYLLFKKQFKVIGRGVLGLAIGIQVAYLIFYLFWGLNYFRPSAAERLNLRDTAYTTADLQAVTSIMIDSANATRARLQHQDTLQTNTAIYANALLAIKKLSADSANFRTYYPGIKPSLLTPIINYLSTSGYYNPFTGEAQMNYQMPLITRPAVACHELSHQTGFGAEDEASFAGFLAGVRSNDRLLRYSVYQMALGECMWAMRRRDTTISKGLRLRLSPQVRYDFIAERRYWLSFRGKAGALSGMFYDDFLKANNQPMGMDTYNQMVLLLVNWYKAGGGSGPGEPPKATKSR